MATFDVTAVFKVSGLANLQKSFRDIGNAASGVQRNLGRFGSDATRFARNVAIAGTAAGAALAGTATRFNEFQRGFTEVVTLLNESSFGATDLEQGIEGLEQGIISLRQETGETFENLNQGLFNLISAGVEAGDAIESLGVATNLAIAGATETNIAVDAITSTLGAYGDAAGSAEDISQKFFTAQVGGKTTVEELARSVGLVASQANSAGVSFDELLGTVSAATVAGIRTNAAFTGLRGAIDNIQKPTSAAQEEAERLGVSFDAAALRSQGLVGVLSAVTQSANFTEDSFVRLFGSVEARNFALALANDEFERANNIIGSVSNETERATNFSNALTAQQNTLSFATQRLGGVFDSLLVGIGERLSPALIEFFNLLADVITEFEPDILAFFTGLGETILQFVQNARANFPEFIATIRETVGSITEGFRAFGAGVIEVFNIVSPFFSDLILILNQVAEQFGFANGFTLLFFAAILQLTGGFRLLFSSVTLFTSVLNLGLTVLTQAIGIFGRLTAAIITYNFALLRTAATAGILGTAKLALIRILSLVALAFRAIPIVALITGVIFLANEIVKLTGFSGGLIDVFRRFGPVILDALGGALQSVLNFVGEVLVQIGLIPARLIALFTGDFGRRLVENVEQAFRNLGATIINIFTGVFDTITNLFTNVFGFFERTQKQVQDTTQNIREAFDERDRLNSSTSNVPGFASGGRVSGPGSKTSDSILARLSNGEYVINARSVDKFGTGLFDMLNRGVLPMFANGGLVEALQSSTSRINASSSIPSLNSVSASPARVGRPLNLILPSGEVIKATTDENTAQKLQRNLRKTDNLKSSTLPGWY